MAVVRMRTSAVRVVCSLLAGAICMCGTASASSGEAVLPTVEANDNLRTAGTLESGILRVALRAGVGRWQPEGAGGPALAIEAFGEVDGALMVPAPLIRVVEGTQIDMTLRNDLDALLVVHGLCTRGGAACAPLQVPPHQTREIRFETGPAGTYHYWASTVGAPVPFRELAGAFVVDAPGAVESPSGPASRRSSLGRLWRRTSRPECSSI